LWRLLVGESFLRIPLLLIMTKRGGFRYTYILHNRKKWRIYRGFKGLQEKLNINISKGDNVDDNTGRGRTRTDRKEGQGKKKTKKSINAINLEYHSPPSIGQSGTPGSKNGHSVRSCRELPQSPQQENDIVRHIKSQAIPFTSFLIHYSLILHF
jgi:hypothetical protein